MFPKSVGARYVRIFVRSWSSHASMRAGVLVGGTAKAKRLRVVNPPERSRRYSSIWGNNRIGTGHARSMLDSPQAWSARWNRVGQWMQIDLGAVKTVSGVVTQGRRQGQWVTRYYVKYSTDGRRFYSVGGQFRGNSNRNTKVKGMFPKSV